MAWIGAIGSRVSLVASGASHTRVMVVQSIRHMDLSVARYAVASGGSEIGILRNGSRRS